MLKKKFIYLLCLNTNFTNKVESKILVKAGLITIGTGVAGVVAYKKSDSFKKKVDEFVGNENMAKFKENSEKAKNATTDFVKKTADFASEQFEKIKVSLKKTFPNINLENKKMLELAESLMKAIEDFKPKNNKQQEKILFSIENENSYKKQVNNVMLALPPSEVQEVIENIENEIKNNILTEDEEEINGLEKKLTENKKAFKTYIENLLKNQDPNEFKKITNSTLEDFKKEFFEIVDKFENEEYNFIKITLIGMEDHGHEAVIREKIRQYKSLAEKEFPKKYNDYILGMLSNLLFIKLSYKVKDLQENKNFQEILGKIKKYLILLDSSTSITISKEDFENEKKEFERWLSNTDKLIEILNNRSEDSKPKEIITQNMVFETKPQENISNMLQLPKPPEIVIPPKLTITAPVLSPPNSKLPNDNKNDNGRAALIKELENPNPIARLKKTKTIEKNGLNPQPQSFNNSSEQNQNDVFLQALRAKVANRKKILNKNLDSDNSDNDKD